jgi:hypothetical protein
MRSGERPAPGDPVHPVDPVELFDGAADPAPVDEPRPAPPEPGSEPASQPTGPLPVEK